VYPTSKKKERVGGFVAEKASRRHFTKIRDD